MARMPNYENTVAVEFVFLNFYGIAFRKAEYSRYHGPEVLDRE